MSTINPAIPLDDTDRLIVDATAEGLPICADPYATIAEQVNLPVSEVMERMQRMLDGGAIRRIGLVPNHYKLGFTANGMTVWDIKDEAIDKVGELIGNLDFVSHCYRRPRRLPIWRYNFFAMAHGKSRDEVAEKAEIIKELLGDNCRAHEILYSTRILKKTGFRPTRTRSENASDPKAA